MQLYAVSVPGQFLQARQHRRSAFAIDGASNRWATPARTTRESTVLLRRLQTFRLGLLTDIGRLVSSKTEDVAHHMVSDHIGK